MKKNLFDSILLVFIVIIFFSCTKSAIKPNSTVQSSNPPKVDTLATSLLPGWWYDGKNPMIYLGPDNFFIQDLSGNATWYGTVGTWSLTNKSELNIFGIGLLDAKFVIKKITKDSLILDVGTFIRQNYQMVTSAPLSIFNTLTPINGHTVQIANLGPMAEDQNGNMYFYNQNGNTSNNITKLSLNSGKTVNVAGYVDPALYSVASPSDNIPATSALLNKGINYIGVDGEGNIFYSTNNEYEYNFIREISISTGLIHTIYTTPRTTEGIDAMCVDIRGNIYFSTSFGRIINKLDSNGKIITIAGTGTSGYSGDGGPALAASLFAGAMATDTQGNIFLSDGLDIRKIDINSGIIYKIAGTGNAGTSGDDGLAILANLKSVNSIFVSNQGDIYLGDYTRIRKITKADGKINTVAGYANSNSLSVISYSSICNHATASTILPMGLIADNNGNVYFVNSLFPAIFKVGK